MPEENIEPSSLDRREDSTSKINNQPPEGVPDKPEDGDFEGPVAWLGGRELIANLKLIALYTIFGNKLDSRDWMTGMVYLVEDENSPHSGLRKANANQDVNTRMVEAGVYTRDVETTRAADEKPENEFWFDYIADTGDGQMATYNVAYIAMRNWSLKTKGKLVSLPRGKFLVIGGDTAYHVADYETLAKRFQAPFWWAYKDLVTEGQISDSERRPLFGIPANHDYYDALDGFNRQFRRPIIGEDDESMSAPQLRREDEKSTREPQLRLPTFERHQEASYIALHLPFDWWFWGLDTESDEIDFRQQEFFKKVNKAGQPKKLIVATPSPTTVFGKYLSKDKPLTKVFESLGLKRPFLREEEKEPKDRLTQGECRLDLSGDIHHYARYWGPDSNETEKPRANQRGDRGQDTRYASVVSGGGGAFFDPTNTYFGEIKEQILFPTEAESRAAMSKEILDFRKIRSGGSVHYIGAGIAFALFFAATFVPNTRSILSTGLGPVTAPFISIGMAAVVLSLLLVIIGNLLFAKAFKRIDKWIEAQKLKGKDKNEQTASKQTWVMVVFLVLTGFLMAFGIFKFRMYRPIMPFTGSLMVFMTLVWSIFMNIIYMQFTERLNQQAKVRPIMDWEFYPTYAILASPVIAFGAALWFFGKTSLPAYLLADIVFLTVVTVSAVGITLLALLVGAERHDWKKGGKIGYLFIGLWHALLQLIIPLLWTLSILHLGMSVDPRWTAAILLLPATYYVFRRFGISQLQRNKRGRLLAIWIMYGLLMIVPPVLYLFVWAGGRGIEEVLVTLPVWGKFAFCLIACGIGTFMSCVWFGWYLAVTMAFNGHNNEAGGAARLEGYKQFIRIRLTNDDLTAYVIGFDKARANGKELESEGNLRIVDQFKLSIN